MLSDQEKIRQVFKDVSMENTLQPSTVEDVYKKFWKSVRYFMNSEEMPKIIIREFGTFEPNLTYIEKQLKKVEESEIQLEKKEREIERLQNVRARLHKEQKSRRHTEGEQEDIQGTQG